MIGWDDVIIGKGDKGNGACKVFEIEGNHSIAQNSVSYWIDDSIIGLGCTIFKDTVEGKTLQNMIKIKEPKSKILSYLERVILDNVSVTKLKSAIARYGKEQYDKGSRDKATEIREALFLQ